MCLKSIMLSVNRFWVTIPFDKLLLCVYSWPYTSTVKKKSDGNVLYPTRFVLFKSVFWQIWWWWWVLLGWYSYPFMGKLLCAVTLHFVDTDSWQNNYFSYGNCNPTLRTLRGTRQSIVSVLSTYTHSPPFFSFSLSPLRQTNKEGSWGWSSPYHLTGLPLCFSLVLSGSVREDMLFIFSSLTFLSPLFLI